MHETYIALLLFYYYSSWLIGQIKKLCNWVRMRRRKKTARQSDIKSEIWDGGIFGRFLMILFILLLSFPNTNLKKNNRNEMILSSRIWLASLFVLSSLTLKSERWKAVLFRKISRYNRIVLFFSLCLRFLLNIV